MTLPERPVTGTDHALPTARTLAILPLGATEQHGPHLPPDTDWIIAQAMAKRTAALLPDLAIEVLPVERVGYSPEHGAWPETRSLTYAEAVERWVGIGAALAERGVRRLMLLNAHGGNSPLLTIVATELRVRHAMLCVATSWTRHGDPAAHVGADEKRLGIHAGLIETSVMLALCPDLVAMDRAAAWPSLQARHERERSLLRAYGPHAHGWAMEDLNPSGAVGDARGASAPLGERLIAEAAAGLAALARETVAFDPPWFGERRPRDASRG